MAVGKTVERKRTEGRMDEADFAAALRRAGLAIPRDRHEAMREAVGRMQELFKILDDPLAYEDEPATLPHYDRGAAR